MKAQLAKDTAINKPGDGAIKDINTELDFGSWHHKLEDGLLDASHEEYQYARGPSFIVGML